MEGGLGLTGVRRLLSLLASSFAFVGLTLTEYLPQEGREAQEREVLHGLLEVLPTL
jgi:hypothetical protein